MIAAAPPGDEGADTTRNLFRLYTKALRVDDSGVVAVPSRYQWSVETSARGYDTKGIAIPDGRVLLRLYDPDHNFTAMTAQMDMATASKLRDELGDLIAEMREDPGYQHRPRLHDLENIPTGRFKGVDRNGTAIIDLEYSSSAARSASDPR